MVDFKKFKQDVLAVEEWLKKEYMQLRTGKASPVVLDNVLVDSYGQKMKINQLASITIEDARSLRIAPWDKSQVNGIEKGIADSNLGLSVNVDESGLRIIFPELTGDRRDALIKVVRGKLEDARISIKKERDDTKNNIEKMKKNGEINEDEEKKSKEEMQKIVDEANRSLDQMTNKKEQEIQG